jgi:hypothetical protein
MSTENSGFREAVVIPLAQSVITGVFIGLASGAGAAVLHFEQPVTIGAALGCCVMAGSWLSYRGRWAHMLEALAGVDLDKDGVIGEPPPPQPTGTTIEIISEDRRAGDYVFLPGIEPERLQQLGAGLMAGQSFNQAAWTGSGRPFSRREFEALRGEFLRRGLCTWRNPAAPAQGCELTPPGEAVARYFAHMETNHSPTRLVKRK